MLSAFLLAFSGGDLLLAPIYPCSSLIHKQFLIFVYSQHGFRMAVTAPNIIPGSKENICHQQAPFEYVILLSESKVFFKGLRKNSPYFLLGRIESYDPFCSEEDWESIYMEEGMGSPHLAKFIIAPNK